MNEQLKSFLIQCGLMATATDAEAMTYLNQLPTAQRSIADTLTKAAAAAAAAPAPAVAAAVAAVPTIASLATVPVSAVVPPVVPAVDLAAVAAADQLAGANAERERIGVITTLASQHKFDAKWVKQHTDALTSVAAVKDDVLAKLAAGRQPLGIGAVVVGDDLNLTSLGPAIASALAIRAGVLTKEIIEPTPGRFDFARNADGSPKQIKHHERSHEFRGMTLLETGRRYFEARGIDTTGWSRNELSARLINKNALYDHIGFSHQLNASTGDFDSILEDTIGKTLRQAYMDGDKTWAQCFRRATAPDFKQIGRTALSESPDLEIIQDNGEIKYVQLSDTKEVYALTDYGNIIPFTRKALINDDMDAFARIPLLQGAAAGRKEDDVAWNIFTANANMQDSVALFHATHANLGTGAISVAALGVMRSLMRKQLGPKSKARLNIKSKFLIVPAALETIAENFLDSQYDPARSNNTPNPFKGKLQLVVEPRLDDSSALEYYTAADSSVIDTVEVCFLDDEPEPVFAREVDFDTEAVKFKVTHTVAAKAIDFRGVARSSGA